MALLLAYSPFIVQTAINLGQQPGQVTYFSTVFKLAHMGLPILVHFGKGFYKNSSVDLSVDQLLFGKRDMKYLSRFFSLILLVSSTAHLVVASKLVFQLTPDASRSVVGFAFELVQVGCLTLNVIVWCLFVVWDMRRVNLTEVSLSMAFFGACIDSLLLGPAAVLAILWRWREHALENGRKRK